MSRSEEQERKIESLEIELRGCLLPILVQVAQGRNTAFFVSSPDRTTIQDLAEQILRLAEHIGSSKESLLASRILNAFDAADDSSDEDPQVPVRLAQTLLEEIGGSGVANLGSKAP
jgi:hypothetical protein